MRLLEFVFCVFYNTKKKNPAYSRITGNSVLIPIINCCASFDSFFRISVPSSFSLSWPIQTSCCPIWVPPTCPTTAAMTCCLCSRTTDRLHARLSVLILFLCCGPPSLSGVCWHPPLVRVSVHGSVCECVLLYMNALYYIFVLSCCPLIYAQSSVQE